MSDEITREDALRYAREQAALLLDTDLTHGEVAEAALALASAFRDIDTGTVLPEHPGDGIPGLVINVRQHPRSHMQGVGELAGVTAPAAVVLRKNGSVDVYGDAALIDQRGITS